MDNDDLLPTPEEIDMITKAAGKLVLAVPELVNMNPLFALAALSLATSQVAAILRVPYESLIELVSRQYEKALVDEVEHALDGEPKGEGEAVIRKRSGVN